MHPLTPDLSKFTDEEVQKKYEELSRRLNQAFRSGPTSIIPQIQLLLQDYQSELSRRNDRMMREMEERAARNGKGFSGIIDIS